MHEVVVYSRKGCHLCEVVKETLAQVQGDAEFVGVQVPAEKKIANPS